MAKFRSIKNSLIAGEISPTAMGRTDLPQYPHACKTLRNMIPLLSGGAYRRPGTLFDNHATEADYSYPRLIPFTVSQSESYVLAFNNHYSTNGIVTATRPINTFGVATRTLVTGTHPYLVSGVSVGAGDYDDIDSVQYVQSVDVMTLVHPNHKPMRVRRSATDTFTIAEFDTDSSGTMLTDTAFRDAWPYRRQNTTAITLAISVRTVGTGRTVTASAAFFNALHVGAVFKSFDGAATYGCFKVTGFTSSTSVTVQVISDLGTTGARATWWESAWSDYRGWPRSVGIYQQRMCYGGNATDRDSIWLSTSANFDAMSVAAHIDPASTPTGDMPFTIVMSSQQLNQIQWISPDKTLVVGTLGDEFIIEPEVESSGFGCDNAKVTAQSNYGSSHHPPCRIGDELIFATASDDELRALTFNLLQNAYSAEPVQLLYDEYPKPEYTSCRRRFRHFAWDKSRNTLWCIDTAGNLFGMTRDRKLNITMWHSHQLGGYVSTETGDDSNVSDGVSKLCSGSVLSVAVIPNPTLNVNDIWLTVKRKISGAWEYHIERFMGRGLSTDTAFHAGLANSGNYFTDASVYDLNKLVKGGAEDYSSNGIYSTYAHLNGKTVEGTTDSERGISALLPAAVAAGVVPMTSPHPPSYATVAYTIIYGLPFTSIVEPVRLEAGSQIGTAQGAVKRIHKATIRFYRTLSAKIGASADLLEEIIFRIGSTRAGYSPELFTGDKTVDMEGDYDTDGYIYLIQDAPLPFAVVSIIAEGQTYD